MTVGSNTATHTYGQDNWEYGWGNVQNDEFAGNFQYAYGIAQAFAENLNTSAPGGYVSADITMQAQAVPEPISIAMAGAGLLGVFVGRKKLRKQ